MNNHKDIEEQYRWIIQDTFAEDVVLKHSTYNSHIEDSSKRSNEAIQNLKRQEENIKKIIKKPRYVYLDSGENINKRIRYTDIIDDDDYGHLMALVVVVEADRKPKEVVTWMLKDKLKQEWTKGGIIYDASKD